MAKKRGHFWALEIHTHIDFLSEYGEYGRLVTAFYLSEYGIHFGALWGHFGGISGTVCGAFGANHTGTVSFPGGGEGPIGDPGEVLHL